MTKTTEAGLQQLRMRAVVQDKHDSEGWSNDHDQLFSQYEEWNDPGFVLMESEGVAWLENCVTDKAITVIDDFDCRGSIQEVTLKLYQAYLGDDYYQN